MHAVVSLLLVSLPSLAPEPAFVAAGSVAVRGDGVVDVGSGDTYVVLDTRSAWDFARGHLPSAQRADWTRWRQGLVTGGRLPDDLRAVADALAALGVDDNRPVLVCGGGDDGWGEEGRVAWLLRYLGHPRTFILDGGCQSLAQRPQAWVWTSRTPRRGTFSLKPRAALRAADDRVRRASAQAGSGDADVPQLLDVRTADEYGGATPWLEARGGHVPGARHLHWLELLDARGKVLEPAAVRTLLERKGLDPARPVVVYCTGGVRSAFATLVLRQAGVDAQNDDASFWAWAEDKSRPVAK